jgi:alpha-L-arabinofuranosidase
VADGSYQQTSATFRDPVSSAAGDRNWRDYTLTLKARKTGGTDGLVITVLDDGAGSWVQWRLGGWGNTQHGILTHYAEQDQMLERVAGTLENNRWYDVKVTIRGAQIECFLDGQLIQKAQVLHHKVPALFTSATRDQATGETILKVVNPGNAAIQATVQLQGVTQLAGTAQAIVLTGNPEDENTFETPNKVVPKKSTVNGIRPQFGQTFGPRTVTVLRLGTR